MITYKKTTTIGQKLTNYKHLAVRKTLKQIKGVSRLYKHCKLCGYHDKHNKSMVICVFTNKDKNLIFPLNQNLTCCTNYGMYSDLCEMPWAVCWPN